VRTNNTSVRRKRAPTSTFPLSFRWVPKAHSAMARRSPSMS